MVDGTGKLIEQHHLENGIEFFMYDQSRVTAGDRWQVELKCEAHIPIDESFWDMVKDEDPQLLHNIIQTLGERMVFVTTRQRNFVDAKEHGPVLQEMVQEFIDSVLKYLKKPHFPREFFKKQYRETHQKELIRKAMVDSNYNC